MTSLLQCKKYVYKNRIRLTEFFRDFDKVEPESDGQSYSRSPPVLFPWFSIRVPPSLSHSPQQLRCGFIFPNHFLSGLNMAGLNKYLSASELQVLADCYLSKRGPSLDQVNQQTTKSIYLLSSLHFHVHSPYII